MTIEGKIFEIIYINSKIVEIVIRKKKGERIYPIAFVGFSDTINDIKTLGLEKTDRIKINFTLMSKKFEDKNGRSRYSTSPMIDGIDLIEKTQSKQIEVSFVDMETGEIL